MIIDIKNAIGKNFGAIPKIFNIEYLKYVDKSIHYLQLNLKNLQL